MRKEKEIDNFNLIFILNDMMALLTPREFINLFPIKKILMDISLVQKIILLQGII
ncbi:hypothetical protein [Clostridium botulinum]|uniref:Uncharacterized protein n=1 Tax=Clostridium botulinum TaxID=1491 RepID=A0A1L7JMH6_CLOBO|nr:hypothetical protein [Clostridium botulinum]APU86894.1 hypothetical protein NPD8_4262 [Clostridium botulinum]